MSVRDDGLRGRWCRRLVLTVLALFLPAAAVAETVRLPMTVDFPLLRSLIVRQVYPEASERAKIVEESKGCNEVWLANPELVAENGLVRLTTDLDIIWGAPVGDSCLLPVRWSGRISFLQQPQIGADWRLRLVTQKSSLIDRAGRPATVSNLVWNLVKDNIHAYIDSIAIDLAPPVDGLKQLMQPENGSVPRPAAQHFLSSLRPEKPQVQTRGIRIDILADVDIPPAGEEDGPVVTTAEDLKAQARVLTLWQTWDALLVRIIDQLSVDGLSNDERQLLLTTLLSVRYEFSAVIGTPELTSSFVRRQFIEAWRAIKPLCEAHLVRQPVDNILGYFSFFTAADALLTLDRIGPLLGMDISRDGFYRMARMLSDQPLDEGASIDSQLRNVLGFGPAPATAPRVPGATPSTGEQVPATPTLTPPPTVPLPDEFSAPKSGIPLPEESPRLLWAEPRLYRDALKNLLDRLSLTALLQPTLACAGQSPPDSASNWTAELTPAAELLPRARTILAEAAEKLTEQLDGTVGSEGWGRTMLEATAWQESCFRQFIVKGGKITYLLSSNSTSVGMMQVNEKVWRGIYDLHELRWNAEYNVVAGSEILALYLNRYMAKEKDFQLQQKAADGSSLASWLYALYNGGPGQVKKFLQRWNGGKLSRIDRSFQQKFEKVTTGELATEVDCLPGS
ncbi:MAG: lytic transglycosylase domain-containing protein [Desulfopila sp.]